MISALFAVLVAILIVALVIFALKQIDASPQMIKLAWGIGIVIIVLILIAILCDAAGWTHFGIYHSRAVGVNLY